MYTDFLVTLQKQVNYTFLRCPASRKKNNRLFQTKISFFQITVHTYFKEKIEKISLILPSPINSRVTYEIALIRLKVRGNRSSSLNKNSCKHVIRFMGWNIHKLDKTRKTHRNPIILWLLCYFFFLATHLSLFQLTTNEIQKSRRSNRDAYRSLWKNTIFSYGLHFGTFLDGTRNIFGSG